MDHKEVLLSYEKEVNELRLKLNQLEVDSVEQRALDQVRQWRQSFNTSSIKQMEKIINEMEKRKQSEVNQLVSELRTSIDQFKEKNLARLNRLDGFISRIGPEDEIQLDYVKFELDSLTKVIESLHFDIVAKVVNTSKQRRSSTILARNTLELSKVFEMKKSQTTPRSSSSFLVPFKNLIHRASISGASYYNVGLLGHQKHV